VCFIGGADGVRANEAAKLRCEHTCFKRGKILYKFGGDKAADEFRRETGCVRNP